MEDPPEAAPSPAMEELMPMEAMAEVWALEAAVPEYCDIIDTGIPKLGERPGMEPMPAL